MDILDLLRILAALINLGFGAFTLWRPQVVAAASGFKLEGARGEAELRIAFGGYFLGMGAALLIFAESAAAQAIGLAWLGAAVIRGVEFIYRRNTKMVDRSFFVIWASEIFTSVILLVQ